MLRRPKIRFPKCLENTSLKIKPSTVAFSSTWSQKNQRYAFCCWKTCNIEFQKCSLNRKRVSLSCNCRNTGGMHKLFTKMLPFFIISFFLFMRMCGLHPSHAIASQQQGKKLIWITGWSKIQKQQPQEQKFCGFFGDARETSRIGGVPKERNYLKGKA